MLREFSKENLLEYHVYNRIHKSHTFLSFRTMQLTTLTFDIYLIDKAINCNTNRMLALTAKKYKDLKHPDIQTNSITATVSSHPNRIHRLHNTVDIRALRTGKEITRSILSKSYYVMRDHAKVEPDDREPRAE